MDLASLPCTLSRSLSDIRTTTVTDMSGRDRLGALAKSLPKIELHAHLTGSISRQTLHEIWLEKKGTTASLKLNDPLTAIPPAKTGIDIAT